MLPQKQYSIWKNVNTIVFSIGVFLFLISFILSWKVNSLKNDIKYANIKLNELNQNINKVKNSGFYQKFQIAKFIKDKENTTNYAGLYSYLNMIKNELTKLLKNNNITNNRFLLKVNKNKVSISLMVPNYNILYQKDSILDNIGSKPFIKKIEINNYKTKGFNAKFVYFDMNLYTDIK